MTMGQPTGATVEGVQGLSQLYHITAKAWMILEKTCYGPIYLCHVENEEMVGGYHHPIIVVLLLVVVVVVVVAGHLEEGIMLT